MILVLRDHRPVVTPPKSKQGLRRGASRPVARKPMAKPLSMPSLSAVMGFFWFLLLMVVLLVAWRFHDRVWAYLDVPITRVRVEGELAYLGRDTVQKSIEPYAQHTFFNANVDAVRQQLEQVPWVAQAEVRKIWPDQLMVRLTEQLPVARWGDNALLSSQGRAFTPEDVGRYANLPKLWGPPHAQQKVMQHYQIFSQLLRPLNFTITSLEMREQGSWYLATGQGIELLLGRERVVDRVRRFVNVYPATLQDKTDNIARVDLRYPNGFAVGWRTQPDAPGGRKMSRQ